MKRLCEDTQHLWRMAALFGVGLVVFVVARAFLVPDDFGVLGHYRAGALADNAAASPVFAGQTACADCHGDVLDERVGSKHAKVSCEACHGPLATHVADPENVKPTRPDPGKICLVCHLANVAKPPAFPQVDVATHAGGKACAECHPHHHPEAARGSAAPAAVRPASPASEVQP